MFDILFLLFLNQKACGKSGFLPLLGFLCQKVECLYVCACVCMYIYSHKSNLFLSLKVTIKQRSWPQYWVIFRDRNTTKEQDSLYFVNVCDTFITSLLLLCYGKVNEAYIIILYSIFIPHASKPVKFQISCGKVCTCLKWFSFQPAICHCPGDKVGSSCYLTSCFCFLESLTKTSHVGKTPSTFLNTFSAYQL